MTSSQAEREEGRSLSLDFAKLRQIGRAGQDVLPVAVQHADTKDMLLIAYVNEAALQQSITTRIATFWSTSRNELWVKGATSGDFLELVEIRVNCEQNSLLFLVRPRGKGVCHTKYSSGDSSGHPRSTCFYRRLTEDGGLEFIYE